MPLSKIDGMVNLISSRRAKERHLIFGACWRHCSMRCEIFDKRNSPSIWGPPTLQNGIPRNGQKKLKNLWLLWNGGEIGILKDPNPIRKNPMKPFGPTALAETPIPPHASPRLNGGGRRPRLTQPRGQGHASLPLRSAPAEHGRAQGSLAPPLAQTRHSATP